MIQENQQNQKQDQKSEKSQKSQKNKISLLKKRIKSNTWNQLYHNIDIKHIFNINDVLFIHQNALKNPDNKQSLLTSIFYYKMISKVAINQDNVIITLKKLNQNALPTQYYLERLRSYGDAKYYNIANYIQNIKNQFSNLNQSQQNFEFDQELSLLQQKINQRKGKMYLIFFSEIYSAGVMLKKIILSSQLLKQIGYNINQIALDFIKYKHIFFQIFTAKMYSTMMQESLRRFSEVTTTLMENQNKTQNSQQQHAIIYNDQMIRRKQVNGSYQQDILLVRVKWTSSHPSVAIFDIDNVQQLNINYTGSLKKIRKLQLPNIQQQLKSLQHLTKIDPSLLQQNKNRCCTFKIIQNIKTQEIKK